MALIPSEPNDMKAEAAQPDPSPEAVPSGESASDANAAVLAASRRQTRRSFVIAGAAAAAGYGFYHWLQSGPTVEMQPLLLRRSFQFNAGLSRTVFDNRGLAPTYPLRRAETLRVNGVFGLKRQLVPDSWRLQLVGARDTSPTDPRFTPDVTAWNYRYTAVNSSEDRGHDTKVDPHAAALPAGAATSAKMPPASRKQQAEANEARTTRPPRGTEEAGESFSTLPVGTPGLLLTLADIQQLPRHELVTQFKCIEGWSQIVHWGGVRMADFLDAFPPAPVNGRDPCFVYMETPDGDYYTSYELATLRHPQALLVTEMMGAPLTQFHGAPLRLHLPMKYGYKQIKRIGLVLYTDRHPDDYWTKLGYDWYAGL